MIWDLDPYVVAIDARHDIFYSPLLLRNGGGKVWGSDDVNVEGWKALKRLPGHDSGLCASVNLPPYISLTLYPRCHRFGFFSRRQIPRECGP